MNELAEHAEAQILDSFGRLRGFVLKTDDGARFTVGVEPAQAPLVLPVSKEVIKGGKRARELLVSLGFDERKGEFKRDGLVVHISEDSVKDRSTLRRFVEVRNEAHRLKMEAIATLIDDPSISKSKLAKRIHLKDETVLDALHSYASNIVSSMSEADKSSFVLTPERGGPLAIETEPTVLVFDTIAAVEAWSAHRRERAAIFNVQRKMTEANTPYWLSEDGQRLSLVQTVKAEGHSEAVAKVIEAQWKREKRNIGVDAAERLLKKDAKESKAKTAFAVLPLKEM